MTESSNLLFLGTGASMGIPVIGCHCSVCSSENHLNKRMRPSALLTINKKHILIDCGPDFHAQAIHYKINILDSMILTHAHHDHTAGVDELRVYNMRSGTPLPCLLSHETAHELRQRFGYLFADGANTVNLVAKIELHELPSDRGTAYFQGFPFRYFSYEQAGMKVTGFRIGTLAYVTDIRNYPDTVFEDLAGVEHLVLSSLRYAPSPLHLSVDEAIEFARRAGAKQTWLTHLAHDLEHEQTNAYLPENVRLAYDGLNIDFAIEVPTPS